MRVVIYDHPIGSSPVTSVVRHIRLPVGLALQVNCAMSVFIVQVKQNICSIMRFMVVLTSVLDRACVNVRLLGMCIQKRTTVLCLGMYV